MRIHSLNMPRRGRFISGSIPSRLQRFDERTWQMGLASDEVNNELARIEPSAVKIDFGLGYGSANDELLHYLGGLFAQHAGPRAGAAGHRGKSRDAVQFAGHKQDFGVYTPPSAATNLVARELAASEYGLLGDATNRLAAIDTIQSVLNSLPGLPSGGRGLVAGLLRRLGDKSQLAVVQAGAGPGDIVARRCNCSRIRTNCSIWRGYWRGKALLQPGDVAQDVRQILPLK